MSIEELTTTLDQKNDKDLDDSKVFALVDYAQQIEKFCNRVINIGKIVFIAFPILLMIIQKLANLDKTRMLLIWIVGMFILAVILIFVGYFDHTLRERLKEVYGDEHELSGKLKMLQGRALVKSIIAEHGKNRSERSIDDFADEFSKYALQDESTLVDRMLQNIATEKVNFSEYEEVATAESGNQIHEYATGMDLDEIIKEFND